MHRMCSYITSLPSVPTSNGSSSTPHCYPGQPLSADQASDPLCGAQDHQNPYPTEQTSSRKIGMRVANKETSKLQITHNRCDIIMTSAISFRRWETQPAPSSMLARALAAFVATRMLLSSKPFLSMIATLNRNQHSQGRKRKPKLETLWISGFMQQLTTMPDGVSTPN